MQSLEVSRAVRPLQGSLGVKGLLKYVDRYIDIDIPEEIAAFIFKVF